MVSHTPQFGTSALNGEIMLPNKAMHRMSGTHISLQFGWPWVPLIGDLDR
jgi:hypothetical protein